MKISTTRFGSVHIEADDILLFPAGIVGFEECRHWVILADADNDSVGWLQCVSRADVALPVVSPRRYMPDYHVRVARGQLAPLQLAAMDQAYVLTIVSKDNGRLTLNLRAPLIVNLDRRLGRQIITADEQPTQFEVGHVSVPLRKSA
jgi:flagellar assembly factor FliW